MSDLVKRLRFIGGNSDETANEAADEIERLTRERDLLVNELADLFGWTDCSYLHAVMHVANAVRNERAERAVQLAALREALEREVQHSVGCPSAIYCNGPDDPRYIAWRALPDSEKCTCDWKRILTDTAAAARETERRLRVEGAEVGAEAMREKILGSGEWHDDGDWVREVAAPSPAAVVDGAFPPKEAL